MLVKPGEYVVEEPVHANRLYYGDPRKYAGKDVILLAWIFRLPRGVRPEEWLACPEASSPGDRHIRLHAMTEGEIFVAIKDAGEGGGKIPSAAEGVEKFRLV